jgi:hypothetical protein
LCADAVGVEALVELPRRAAVVAAREVDVASPLRRSMYTTPTLAPPPVMKGWMLLPVPRSRR